MMNSPFPADGRLVPFGARAPLSMGGNPGKDARGRATGRVKNLCPWAGDAGWRRNFAVLQGKKPGILYVLQDFVQGRAAKGLAGRPSTPDKYRFQTPPENPGRRFLPPPPSGHLFCLEMPEHLLYNRWDSKLPPSGRLKTHPSPHSYDTERPGGLGVSGALPKGVIL